MANGPPPDELQPDQSDARGSLWWIVLAHAVLLAVAIAPFLVTRIPPLGDLPNHVARIHILLNLPHSAALRDNYESAWSLIPNLIFDTVTLPLAALVGLVWATRLYVLLTFASLVGGVVAIHAALYRRPGITPLAMYLFLYGLLLNWGYVSYLLALGLALQLFAAWLWRRERLTVGWHVGFAVATAVLFMAQLPACAVFALLLGGYELGRGVRHGWPRPRAAAAMAAIFVPALLLWLAAPVWNAGTATVFGNLHDKFNALLSPVLFAFGRSDYAVAAAALLAALAAVLAGRARLAGPLLGPLLVLGLVAMVLPNWLFGIYGVDFRLPLAIVAVAIAGLGLRRPRPWLAAGLFALVLVVTGFRAWGTARTFAAVDRQYDEVRAVSDLVPRGARLLTVRSTMGTDPSLRRAPLSAYEHLGALLVISRDVFYAPMLTFVQPLRPSAATRGIDSPHGHALAPEDLAAGADPANFAALAVQHDQFGHNAYWDDWPHRFDYVLWADFGARIAPDPRYLDLLYRGSFFHLFRVRPGATPAR